MSMVKKMICAMGIITTICTSMISHNNVVVSAWAYNVNNSTTYPYINYPSVITNGNSENNYIKAYGLTRNRIDKSGEHHVRVIQYCLNVTMDGIIGNNTDYAIKEYQRNNGLDDDGIVGKDTYRYLMYDNSVIGYTYNTGYSSPYMTVGVINYTK
ncbi:peptidoglycan-binding domain-containing protein [Ruminococcus sp. HUN007]|uniref:peptidoglycan-binding domain-containing protein n=1 Tax=Ruminococcus sp. HUN007 TaxID=1514668 RepID=UPI0005D227D0|nr:peptidoglycan-binding domain-containing protein [Ruminococcus sp. HUN007]